MRMLSVKPVGTALVPDYVAVEQGVLRFVGRRHNPTLGANGGWVPVEGAVEVPLRAEYIQELKAGTLHPADEETAKLAGVEMPQ